MKKQVTFAENGAFHRVYQPDALRRLYPGTQDSKMAPMTARSNISTSFKPHKPAAATPEPQLQHGTNIHVPKARTSAPFLKHTDLTPGQREYLYTMAASNSPMHVRNLINQHYMNVLYRGTTSGCSAERSDLTVTSVTSMENGEKQQSEEPVWPKREAKINTGAKNPGKTILPKISNSRVRSSNTSASKHVKRKTHTGKQSPVKRKSPTKTRIKVMEEEDDDSDDGREEDDTPLDYSPHRCDEEVTSHLSNSLACLSMCSSSEKEDRYENKDFHVTLRGLKI